MKTPSITIWWVHCTQMVSTATGYQSSRAADQPEAKVCDQNLCAESMFSTHCWTCATKNRGRSEGNVFLQLPLHFKTVQLGCKRRPSCTVLKWRASCKKTKNKKTVPVYPQCSWNWVVKFWRESLTFGPSLSYACQEWHSDLYVQ